MESKNLQIEEIWIRQHEVCPNGVIGIAWSGSAGFGQYELIMEEDGKLHAWTEGMDDNDDKLFTKELLNLLIEKIIIDG